MKKTTLFLVIFLILSVSVLSACQSVSISFTATSVTIAEGDEPVYLSISVTPDSADYTLVSSDPTVVEVVGKRVKGLKYGSAVVTATSGSASAEITVNVLGRKDPARVTISFFIEEQLRFTSTVPIGGQLTSDDVESIDWAPDGYWYDNQWFLDENCTEKASLPLKVGSTDFNLYSRWILADGSDPYHPLPLETEGSTALGLLYPDLPYKNIVFPDNITVVHDEAFKGNTTIKSVDFCNVAKIEVRAFYSCPSLEKITVKTGENGLSVISAEAFASSALRSVETDKDNLYALRLSDVGVDAFRGTPFLFSSVQSDYSMGDNIPRYKGFFLGKFMLGYSYRYMSDYHEKTLTLVSSNVGMADIKCTFSESDIRVVLKGYLPVDALVMKTRLVDCGIVESNITVID